MKVFACLLWIVSGQKRFYPPYSNEILYTEEFITGVDCLADPRVECQQACNENCVSEVFPQTSKYPACLYRVPSGCRVSLIKEVTQAVTACSKRLAETAGNLRASVTVGWSYDGWDIAEQSLIEFFLLARKRPGVDLSGCDVRSAMYMQLTAQCLHLMETDMSRTLLASLVDTSDASWLVMNLTDSYLFEAARMGGALIGRRYLTLMALLRQSDADTHTNCVLFQGQWLPEASLFLGIRMRFKQDVVSPNDDWGLRKALQEPACSGFGTCAECQQAGCGWCMSPAGTMCSRECLEEGNELTRPIRRCSLAPATLTLGLLSAITLFSAG